MPKRLASECGEGKRRSHSLFFHRLSHTTHDVPADNAVTVVIIAVALLLLLLTMMMMMVVVMEVGMVVQLVLWHDNRRRR